MTITAEDVSKLPAATELHLHKTARGWLLVKRPSRYCGTDRCIHVLVTQAQKLEPQYD